MVVLILLLVCVGWAVQQESSRGVSSSTSPPPAALKAYSEEGLQMLVNAAQLSDEAYAEFLKQADAHQEDYYIWNTVDKKYVEALAKVVTEVGIPVLKEGTQIERFDMEYRLEQETLDILYDMQGIRYRFFYSRYSEKEEYPNDLRETVWRIGEDSITMERGKFHDTWLYGYLYTQEYRISVGVAWFEREATQDFVDAKTFLPAEFTWSNHAYEQPPRTVIAYSQQTLQQLLDAAQLPEAEFAEFVQQAYEVPDDRLFVCRDLTKQEAAALARKIEAAGMPRLPDGETPEVFQAVYDADTEEISVFYRKGGTQYRFDYVSEGKEIPHMGEQPEAVWNMGEDVVALYRSEEKLIGELKKSGQKILITVTSYKKFRDFFWDEIV